MLTSLDDWQAAGEFIDFQDHRVFVRVDGPPGAPALLLIHGFPTASWDWCKLWRELAQHHRLVAFDLLGLGFSAKPRGHDYRVAEQADIALAALAHAGVKEAAVLAHDLGDTVAQELLARHADGAADPRPHSCTLLNGGLFPETHRPRLVQKLLISPLGPLVARLTTKEKISATMRAIFGAASQPGDDLLQGYWQLMTHHDGLRALPKLIRYMQERRDHRERWVGALRAATIPLKVIDGMADPISGAHMVARYRALVPEADVTELAGIGHYPQVEAPQSVLQAFLAFRAQA